jgi:hypothetical protein
MHADRSAATRGISACVRGRSPGWWIERIAFPRATARSGRIGVAAALPPDRSFRRCARTHLPLRGQQRLGSRRRLRSCNRTSFPFHPASMNSTPDTSTSGAMLHDPLSCDSLQFRRGFTNSH